MNKCNRVVRVYCAVCDCPRRILEGLLGRVVSDAWRRGARADWCGGVHAMANAVAALTGDSPLYYALLVPAMLPVLLLFVVVNWVALKFFRAN